MTVGRTWPRVRVSNGAPMRASSSATCRLMVGGARLSWRAASAKEPRSEMTTRVRRRSRLISRMGQTHSEKMNISIIIFKFSLPEPQASIGHPSPTGL
ncbi:hypothetical protein D3C71_1822800 [compost metagenome]